MAVTPTQTVSVPVRASVENTPYTWSLHEDHVTLAPFVSATTDCTVNGASSVIVQDKSSISIIPPLSSAMAVNVVVEAAELAQYASSSSARTTNTSITSCAGSSMVWPSASKSS